MSSRDFSLKKITNTIPGLDFDCGDDEINEYFHSKIYEDEESGNCMAYFLFLKDDFIGFFTLSNSKLHLSIDGNKKSWPAVLLGQIGVQVEHQRNGYGSLMILLAKKLSFDLRSCSGCRILIIKTYKKHLYESFYEPQGFLPSNETDSYYDLFYDLNDWVSEKEEVIQNWDLDII